MSRIARQKITRHYDAAGKRCAASQAVRKQVAESRKWYAFDVPGSDRPIPLATDRRVSERMLARLIAEGEATRAGLPVRRKPRPMAELLGQFREHLEHRADSEAHVRAKSRRVERVVMGLGWRTAADLDGPALERWLADQASLHDWSPSYRNQLLAEAGSFCRWLVGRGELRADPTSGLKRWPEGVDVRRGRRPLSPDELRRLLEASPPGRRLIYLVAVSTGFRAGELASLTPSCLCLGEDPPVVVLPARRDKRRQAVRQPIPPEVAAELAAFAAGRAPADRLWPGCWWRRAAEMLRVDLGAAGIAYVVEGPDGPLHADFHALRHTYISLLDRAGVSLKQAMALARHSDPKLTLRRYGRVQLADLGRAVEGLVTPLVTPGGDNPGYLANAPERPDRGGRTGRGEAAGA